MEALPICSLCGNEYKAIRSILSMAYQEIHMIWGQSMIWYMQKNDNVIGARMEFKDCEVNPEDEFSVEFYYTDLPIIDQLDCLIHIYYAKNESQLIIRQNIDIYNNIDYFVQIRSDDNRSVKELLEKCDEQLILNYSCVLEPERFELFKMMNQDEVSIKWEERTIKFRNEGFELRLDKLITESNEKVYPLEGHYDCSLLKQLNCLSSFVGTIIFWMDHDSALKFECRNPHLNIIIYMANGVNPVHEFGDIRVKNQKNIYKRDRKTEEIENGK